MIGATAPKAVAFRADASVTLGSGHVMRCLVLADELRSRGASIRFICRDEPGHLGARIAASGHALSLLPATGPLDEVGDATASLAALGVEGVQLMVVDHYALGAVWEGTLRSHCRRLMAVDDLADRAHDVDILLDQNLGRRPEDYARWLPRGAVRLVGPEYALLRSEFAANRQSSLARRAAGRLEHVLVTMGGSDPSQATVRVLEVLASADASALDRALSFTVVLGGQAATRARVEALVATLRWRTELLIDAGDMAKQLLRADLVIGAAGSSAWERCCLGVPTLMMILADNQRHAALSLEQAGAALSIPLGRSLGRSLSSRLSELAREPTKLQRMSACAARITDGRGAARVAAAVLDARAALA